MSGRKRLAPGWGRIRSFLKFREVGHNYVELYHEAIQKFGTSATIYLPRLRTVFYEPEHVKYIFKDNHKNFSRGRDFKEMEPLLGQGLLTSEGEHWKRQRRVLAPEFQLQRIHTFQPIVKRATEAMAEKWAESARNGRERDLGADMMKLTFQIVGEVFFGNDVIDEAERFGQNLHTSTEGAVARMVSAFRVPRSWPTAHHRKLDASREALFSFIMGLIERRKKEGADRSDLLSRLMKATDEETGEKMSDAQIRDELITFVSAGHETTSLTLTWTWYLLSQHPEIEGRLVEELRAKVGGRIPSATEFPTIPYNKMVIQEAMRVRPPVSAVSRDAREEDEIAGFHIPKGSSVSVVIWSSHRNPKYWDDPETFHPERFTPEKFQKLPPFVYYPFGGGPHICIGETFSMMEAQMILGGLAQRFKVTLLNPPPVEPFPLITLRPKVPLRVKVSERA